MERQSLSSLSLNVLDFPLKEIRSIITITGVGEQKDDPDTEACDPSFSIQQAWVELQQQCTDSWGWTPDVIEIEGSEQELLSSFLEGNFCIISDGSYQDEVGSFATQVTTKDCRNRIWLLGQTPGSPEDQSAYRSELAGIFSGVQLVALVRKASDNGVRSSFRPSAQVACDGKAALDNSFDTWTLKPTSKQFDMVSAIRSLVHCTKVSWLPRHVKGHQDSTLPTRLLDWWALCNIECDARAKRYHKKYFSAIQKQHSFGLLIHRSRYITLVESYTKVCLLSSSSRSQHGNAMPKNKTNPHAASKPLAMPKVDATKAPAATNAGKNDLKLSSGASPKEPDLISKVVERLEDPSSFVAHFTNETMDLKWLSIIQGLWKDDKGNEVWEFWNQNQFIEHWDFDTCNHYGQRCIDPPNTVSFEDFVQIILDKCGSWENLDNNIVFALDPRKIDTEPDGASEMVWSIRKLVMSLAQQDPLLVFGFDEELLHDSFENRYWDKTFSANPELKIHERPLAMFWVLAVFKMGHPWSELVHSEVGETFVKLQEEEARLEALRRGVETEAERVKAAKRDAFESPDRHIRQNPKRHQVPLSSTGITPENQSQSEDVEFDDEMQENEEETGSGISNNLTPNVSKNSVVKFGDVTAVSEYEDRSSVTSPPKPTKTATSTTFAPHHEVVKKAVSTRIPSTASVRPETYAEAASLPPSVSSDAQLIQRLMQPDLYGMIWEHVHIFAVTVNMPWNGTDAEQTAQDRKNKNIRASLEDRTAKAIKAAIIDAMKGCSTVYKLALLPISDSTFRDSGGWISSPKQIQEKLLSWTSLSDYLDRTGTQNVGYVLKKPEDAKERRLRTRVRFGFNKATPEAMRSYLSDYFNTHCNGGVYDTPLPNIGSISQPGAFPYYSAEIDKELFAHQLMLLTGFKCPIAVQNKWPSDLAFGKSDDTWRYGDNIQIPHITCASKDTMFLDREMHRIFSLAEHVPKEQYPWGSPCQYIPDPKLLRSGKLSMGWNDNSRRAMARMIAKAKNHLHVTEVIRCPIRLPGMLTRVPLTKWGSRQLDAEGEPGAFIPSEPMSLLRFLWSIKCTPEKTEDADEAEGLSDPLTSETEDTSDLTTELSTVKSNASTPQYIKRREAWEKAAQKLTKQDKKRWLASPIWTVIQPSGGDPDIWLFTTRKKYSTVARNILNDLVAFLIFFLQEDTIEQEDIVLRKWVDSNQVQASRERGKTWMEGENAAVSQVEQTQQMDLGMGFLDELDMDDPIQAAFRGRVSIDLEMADVRSIDEGATIVGILNEQMRIKQSQDELVEALSTIAQERLEKLAQAKRVAELEAKLAHFQNLQVVTPAKPNTQAALKFTATQKPKQKQKQAEESGGSTKVDSGGSSSARRP